MGAILGIGTTHAPALMYRGNMADRFKRMLDHPDQPKGYRDPRNWPEEVRREWGTDDGAATSDRHRADLMLHFKKVRKALDDFAPDLIVIWGDDQYENFREDIIPPYCVIAAPSFEATPWARSRGENSWGEPADTLFHIEGHQPAGKYLATRLLEQGFDLAYAYRPLHHDLPHAFLNTVLFLDWERKGWTYPLIPFHVNCYGRHVIAGRGGNAGLGANRLSEADLDPPSPSPWRCFDLGRATARAFLESPWRVALIASSAWSHGQLTPKHSYLWPDVAADRRYYDALVSGDYDLWRNTTTAQIEDRGHQELLNWFCLVGAMAELGHRVTYSAFLEAWVLNTKVFTVFEHEAPSAGRGSGQSLMS